MMINVQDSQAHELTHAAIGKNYGCVNHSISIKITGDGEYTCNEYKGERDRDTEMMLHSMNEIVSYNLFSLVNVIQFSVLLLMNTLFFIYYNIKFE